MAQPLVIHTYRPACATVAQPPGFGDFLRGSIALHQLARKLGFDLHLDFSSHPLSGHIMACDSPPPFPDATVHEFFNRDWPKLGPFLSGLGQDSITLLTSNGWPMHGIDHASQTFIQRRISPRPVIAQELAALRSSLDLQEFCSVHLRLGDQSFGVESVRIPGLEAYFREELLPKWDRRVLIVSDNHSIKERMSNLFSLPLIRNRPIHLGQCGTIDLPFQGVRDAYLDFLLLTCSQEIYQLSVYPWGSGFSSMAALIFGKPLSRIDLRLQLDGLVT